MSDFRHECEVRYVLQRREAEGREAVDRFVGMVREKRGNECADRLLSDAREQWELGNRGAKGEWRERMEEAA